MKAKRCGLCNSEAVVFLSSVDKMLCNNCKQYSDWTLKQGQKSVLIEGKVGEISRQKCVEKD